MDRKNSLLLDIDSGEGFLWRVPPMWDDLLDLVRMEARRLSSMYPLGDIAVIMRSDNGWYIMFPHAELTKEEEESIMWASMSHYGHRWFSALIHDTTLRVSKKDEKNSHEPFLREIIELGKI